MVSARRIARHVLGGGVTAMVAAGGGCATTPEPGQRKAQPLPTSPDVLFWKLEERDAAFRVFDQLPHSRSRVVARGVRVRPLPRGNPLDIELDPYFDSQRIAGLVILQDGKIRAERYGMDFTDQERWTSFSVAKSMTSTLVGAALRDGYIRSLDDKVPVYIPDLKGSAYDDVSVEQLLTMTSGVRWNEDYEDPHSDVAQFGRHQPDPGVDVTVSYVRRLPRAAPPGTQWVYSTAETNLLGLLVSSATGRNLSDYLSEKVWGPFGMEQDASWLLDSTGQEISGCCLQAPVRDFARFGQFILEGGVADGKAVLPDDWLARATTARTPIPETFGKNRGYGFQWWTLDDGAFMARGIFGQAIFIDPARRLVVASNGSWPRARDPVLLPEREAFFRRVQQAVDREGSR